MHKKTKAVLSMTLIGSMLVAPSVWGAGVETTEWYGGQKTMTITAGEDALSGVKEVQYSLDDGAWTVYTDPIVLTKTTNVKMKTIDNATNESEVKEVNVRIDGTAPTVPTIGKDPVAEWTRENVTITIAAGTDQESGVARTVYSLNQGNDWVDYTTQFQVTNEGKTEVWAKTIDEAGNESDIAKVTVGIDRTAPGVPTYSIN